MSIKMVYHPDYLTNFINWWKYRRTYEGGKTFVENYLKKFSDDESPDDFNRRKDISYCPAHAKWAVNKVKNALFQRFIDITRNGGSEIYQNAVKTDIDLLGNSLNTFLGTFILPELLTIGKTYIYVDSPIIKQNTSVLGTLGKRPYIYFYAAENVLSWTQGTSRDPKEFTSVMLVDRAYEMDPTLHLPMGYVERFRYMYLEKGAVKVQFYKPIKSENNVSSNQIIFSPGLTNTADLEVDGAPQTLNISEIPLIPLSLTDSLLTDIADYQIALLNLASSDMAYLIKSNTVMYTEQFDAKLDGIFKRMSQQNGTGTSDESQVANDKQIQLGFGKGRGYPVGTERPGFISPSTDPVKVSMDKQKLLMDEIDRLIDIKLETMSLTGTAKKMDAQGLEAGLSYIGLILEQCDRKIARFFSMYEGSKEVAVVSYPTDYSLKTDNDRKVDADNLAKLKDKVPSRTYQKEISKQVARILLGHKLSNFVMKLIENEIENANYMVTDVQSLATAHQEGFATADTCSIASGFAPGEAEKAKVEHAERLALIAASQSSPGIRGVTDVNNQQSVSDKTSQSVDQKGTTQNNSRGEGKQQ